MNTRSKIRRNQENNSTTSQDCDENLRQLVLKYEKSQDELQSNLIKKDKLIQTLMDEQECNMHEFEKLCLEKNNLNKKYAEAENSKLDLIDEIEFLKIKLNNMTAEKEKCEEEILKGIYPLKQNIQKIKDDYDNLLIRHNNLQIESGDRLMRQKSKKKKKKVTFKSKSKNKRMSKILKKLRRINKKCEDFKNQLKAMEDKNRNHSSYQEIKMKITEEITASLSEQNNLLLKEVEQRNRMIEYVQNENEKVLKLVHDYENDMKLREQTTLTVDHIEKQVEQLKNLLDNGCVLMKPSDASNSIPNEPAVNTRTRTIEMSNKKNVLIFSDSYGKGLGDKLSSQSSAKILNLCSPGSTLKELALRLVDSVQSGLIPASHVLVVGERVDISRSEFKDVVTLLNDISKHSKLILYSLPYYRNQRNYNEYVYKLNLDLYNMTCMNTNIHLIDINNNLCIDKHNSRSSIKFTLCKLLLSSIDAPIGKQYSTVIEIITTSEEESVQQYDNNTQLQTIVNSSNFLRERLIDRVYR